MAPQDAGGCAGRRGLLRAGSRGTGALFLPSTVYGYGDSHFRLGLGREDFSAGLEVLEAFLKRVLAER